MALLLILTKTPSSQPSLNHPGEGRKITQSESREKIAINWSINQSIAEARLPFQSPLARENSLLRRPFFVCSCWYFQVTGFSSTHVEYVSKIKPRELTTVLFLRFSCVVVTFLVVLSGMNREKCELPCCLCQESIRYLREPVSGFRCPSHLCLCHLHPVFITIFL